MLLIVVASHGRVEQECVREREMRNERGNVGAGTGRGKQG